MQDTYGVGITLTDEGDVNLNLQTLINNGMAWTLEGHVGRAAMDAIENGDCILGEVGHRDYWGNYIPSRHEVQAGTKGSVEYAERMRESRDI